MPREASSTADSDRAGFEGSVEPGLCGRCAHARPIETPKGSTFLLCGRSRTDPAYPRYPRLPMLACRGFEPREGAAGP